VTELWDPKQRSVRRLRVVDRPGGDARRHRLHVEAISNHWEWRSREVRILHGSHQQGLFWVSQTSSAVCTISSVASSHCTNKKRIHELNGRNFELENQLHDIRNKISVNG
jgi:hypothetical protein